MESLRLAGGGAHQSVEFVRRIGQHDELVHYLSVGMVMSRVALWVESFETFYIYIFHAECLLNAKDWMPKWV